MVGLFLESNMSTGIIIQARMGSTRLPGKVLEILGSDLTPLLLYVYKRVKRSKKVDQFIIATSTDQKDDPIYELALENNISVFRGSENNVLKRFYDTAKENKLTTIIRINADCPFIDPVIIDLMIDLWRKNSDLDYLSTILNETFPLGMHIEIFSFDALADANINATLDEEKEHVTPYIYNNSKFNKLSYDSEKNLSKYRLTIDFPEDLVFARKVIKILESENLGYSIEELISVLEKNPYLTEINSEYKKRQFIPSQ